MSLDVFHTVATLIQLDCLAVSPSFVLQRNHLNSSSCMLPCPWGFICSISISLGDFFQKRYCTILCGYGARNKQDLKLLSECMDLKVT